VVHYKSVVDRVPFIVDRQAVDPAFSCFFFFFCTHPVLASAGCLVFLQVAWGTELGAGVWNYTVGSNTLVCSIVGQRSGPSTTLASVREQLTFKLLMMAQYVVIATRLRNVLTLINSGTDGARESHG